MHPESAQIRREDILIVDDLPDNLRVLSTTLARQGYGVRCAKSGSMALMGIETFLPDLILLDIRMPEMDGYEVCRRIKANPKTQDIAVIFLSALDDVPDKVKAFQVGGADYITKPFETEEVLARVKHQLLIRRLQWQLMEQNQQLLQEICDRQQVEMALRQEIAERILTEVALQDAKELAEAASHVKSEFLSRVSHELRTPLNAILGFTQLIATDSTLPPDHQDYIRTIAQNGQHLLSLVNNVLSFTQAEASQLTLHRRYFNLTTLLNRLEAIWQPKATAKHLHLVVERAPDLPSHIQADESKLRQVLTSLLDNALKFTDQGAITLRVHGDSTSWPIGADPEAFSSATFPLYFEVEDNGCSMAPHEIEQSFEGFAQTACGHRLDQGLGLGLSISRQFVHLMGGDITVSSEVGRGTCVTFHIQAALPALADLPGEMVGDNCEEYPIAFPAELPFYGLTPAILQAAMPLEWVGLLHQAAVRGFDQAILQLIQEIPLGHAAIAKTLAHWSRNFQFDHILALTQPLMEGSLGAPDLVESQAFHKVIPKRNKKFLERRGV